MKINRQLLKERIVYIICLLYIMLFTYAAVSKIIDYNDFSIQLGQSPLLSAFAGYVAIVVPVVEMIIVIMLVFPGWRAAGLLAAFTLMVAFTAYIYIILNYSSYVPCSCGGILEDLSWTEHILFNLAFVFLALLALILMMHKDNSWLSNLSPLAFSGMILGFAAFSIASVTTLFLVSEEIIHKRNNFVRRFPAHAEPAYNKFNLEINSYYFAGISDNIIYLGNFTAPAYVTLVDTTFATKTRNIILPDQPDLPFRDIKLSVIPPYFFITDGTVPAIFKGSTQNWKAIRHTGAIPYFTMVEPMDSTNIAFRLSNLTKKQTTLAVYNLDNRIVVAQNTDLIKKQIDGIFDTDGTLHYNDLSGELHYVYYYRNQYITADRNTNLVRLGKTIDTVEIAKIEVSELTAGDKQISKPPIVINKASAAFKNLIFIKSDRIGKFEDKEMLKDASIIDVYNVTNNTYVGSMYVYHVYGNKLRSFKVVNNKLYTLSGKYLSVNRIPHEITNSYNP